MAARFHQFLFVISLLLLCWLGMQAVHELGHVIGATMTGGTVKRVILHPLTISRTDVSPNPSPAIVVWMGPIVGCLIPLLLAAIASRQNRAIREISRFFAGFCLVANGVYIAMGSFDGVGDCGTMLATGSPHWLLIAFGLCTTPMGLVIWHRIGSVSEFIRNQRAMSSRLAYTIVFLAITAIVAEVLLSPR